MNKSEIGTAIAERRDTLDITQARLAKLSGVSVHTLFNLETSAYGAIGAVYVKA